MHPITAVKNGIKAIATTVRAAVVWVSMIFTEPDGNGGKPSFSRIAGGYVTYRMVDLAMTYKAGAGDPIPDTMWKMFMVLVGYACIAKLLNTLSPAVLDMARGYALKMGFIQPTAAADQK